MAAAFVRTCPCMNNPIITYRGTVYPWHCDHMGHMNVMWYVGKFDEATWHLFARLGLTPSFLRESGRGMAAVEQTIQYKRELLAGDLITIRSSVIGLKEKSIRSSTRCAMTIPTKLPPRRRWWACTSTRRRGAPVHCPPRSAHA